MLLQQVAAELARHPAQQIPLATLRPAAVLVPLFLREDEPWLLLTRRTEQLKKHSGEISFPGGGAEEQDSDFWQTALRETEEEVGVPPEMVRIVGRLDDYVTGTGFVVAPVVGMISPPYPVNPDPFEVADVFEAALIEGR